jgi:hypothetical protein
MTISPEWVQAIAAIATLIAALAALNIAADAPERAATFAELRRSESRIEEVRQALQRHVLVALMKCRASIIHQDALSAINLVDLAFMRSHGVRDARASFMEAAAEGTPERIIERYHALIAAVVREMGLSDHFSGADLRGGYYPQLLGRIDQATLAEAEAKIAARNA